MEPAKFGQFLPSADARLGAEAAERAAADDRARQRERFERELAKIDKSLARAEQAQQARELAEAERTFEWMKRNGPQRRRGQAGGGGRPAGGSVRNTPQELRAMLADAKAGGHERLAFLLEQSLKRAQGAPSTVLERSSTPGATVRVV